MDKFLHSKHAYCIRVSIFILMVFFCEAIVTGAMVYLFQRPLKGGLILIDAGALTIILLPAFYYLLYRPMDSEMEKRGMLLKGLEEQERKFRLMMESMNDPVYICSMDYRILYMNPAMIKRTGRDATGECCHRVIHGRDEICSWCINDKIRRGEYAEYEEVSPVDGRF